MIRRRAFALGLLAMPAIVRAPSLMRLARPQVATPVVFIPDAVAWKTAKVGQVVGMLVAGADWSLVGGTIEGGALCWYITHDPHNQCSLDSATGELVIGPPGYARLTA